MDCTVFIIPLAEEIFVVELQMPATAVPGKYI
jgi:hypothetical protein